MTTANVTSTAVETQVSFDINQAIESHLPMAEKIATRAYYRYGKNYEKDDLQGYAHLGLVRAARKYAARYDIRQAIDFTAFCEKRIWRNIEQGRETMHVGHGSVRMAVRRGQMSRPTFVHDTCDNMFADTLVSSEENPADLVASRDLPELAWLRKQNPAYHQVVELRFVYGLTWDQIATKLNRSTTSVDRSYRSGMKLLQWKYAGRDLNFHN